MIWPFFLIAAVWVGGIIGLSGMVIYALRTGRLPNKFQTVLRDETPKTFYALICAWTAMIAGMVYFAYFVASAPGIGLI